MIYAGKRNGIWGFYLSPAGVDPCTELTDEQHAALFRGQAEGKRIVFDGGAPCLAEPEPPPAPGGGGEEEGGAG